MLPFICVLIVLSPIQALTLEQRTELETCMKCVPRKFMNKIQTADFYSRFLDGDSEGIFGILNSTKFCSQANEINECLTNCHSSVSSKLALIKALEIYKTFLEYTCTGEIPARKFLHEPWKTALALIPCQEAYGDQIHKHCSKRCAKQTKSLMIFLVKILKKIPAIIKGRFTVSEIVRGLTVGGCRWLGCYADCRTSTLVGVLCGQDVEDLERKVWPRVFEYVKNAYDEFRITFLTNNTLVVPETLDCPVHANTYDQDLDDEMDFDLDDDDEDDVHDEL